MEHIIKDRLVRASRFSNLGLVGQIGGELLNFLSLKEWRGFNRQCANQVHFMKTSGLTSGFTRCMCVKKRLFLSLKGLVQFPETRRT